MRVVSTFAGIGGFDLGFQQAGCEVIAHAENDPDCSQLLSEKFPHVPAIGDVRALIAVMRRMRRGLPVVNYEVWKERIELLRTADVWTAGFPCQDLSVAGQRRGLAGERSGLWFAFRRIAALFRPLGIVLENVPGLLSSQEGRDFAVLLSGLEELGYGLAWRSPDAQYFGLAQRRERVVIVASLGTLSCAEVLFESESVCWDSPPSREAGQRVAPTIAGCSNGGGANGPGRTADDAEALIPSCANPIGAHHSRQDLDHDTYVAEIGGGLPELAGCLQERDAKGADSDTKPGHLIPISHGGFFDEPTPIQGVNGSGKAQNGIGVGEPGDEMFTLTSRDQHAVAFRACGQDGFTPNEHVAPPIAATDGGGAGVPTIAFSCKNHGQDAGEDLSPTLRAMEHDESHSNGGGQVAVAFTQNQREEVRELKVASSVSGIRRGDAKNETLVQHRGVRRLTPLECERLQGFPDNWTAGFSDSTRYRMTGNAFPPPMARWIAKRLITHLKPKP